jgi:hypothetical protein
MINDGGPAFPTDSEHMSREAIEEAIEVLEDASAEMLMETGDKNYYIEAIAVLRQALVDADDTSQERVARYGLAREIESKLKEKNGG